MTMSREQILREYRTAKDRDNQITILADMNCTKRAEIMDILLEMGVPEEELPKSGRRKKKTQKDTAGEVEAAAECTTDGAEENRDADEQRGPAEMPVEIKGAADKKILLDALIRAAAKEEEQIDMLNVQYEQMRKTLREHEERMNTYSRYIKELRA